MEFAIKPPKGLMTPNQFGTFVREVVRSFSLEEHDGQTISNWFGRVRWHTRQIRVIWRDSETLRRDISSRDACGQLNRLLPCRPAVLRDAGAVPRESECTNNNPDRVVRRVNHLLIAAA